MSKTGLELLGNSKETVIIDDNTQHELPTAPSSLIQFWSLFHAKTKTHSPTGLFELIIP